MSYRRENDPTKNEFYTNLEHSNSKVYPEFQMPLDDSLDWNIFGERAKKFYEENVEGEKLVPVLKWVMKNLFAKLDQSEATLNVRLRIATSMLDKTELEKDLLIDIYINMRYCKINRKEIHDSMWIPF